MLTLFARKEPTDDAVSLQHGLSGKLDTVLYRDANFTLAVCRWPWHYTSCPRRGQRSVVLNCYRWKLRWSA